MEQRIKCNRCKMNMTVDKFNKKRDDSYMKSCIECLEYFSAIRNKNKCEHGREKSRCIDCGGAYICEHKKLRNTCKECGGTSICEHKKRRHTCKDCGGASVCEHNIQRNTCRLCCKDVIKLTIKNMINHSKESDKKYNRYDPVNLIDECFVKNIIDDYTHCYYEDCKVELQYLEYNDTLGTIERIDNSIGHIKSNCVICCFKCNSMKKSNKNIFNKY